MLDMRDYRNACDRLKLDTETLEEMIEMTEDQKKKVLGRPARAMLVAAALVAAMAVTASAAELPAVQQFFARVFVTVSTNGDSPLAGLNIPALAVEEREGRTILLLDDQEIDVTDDLSRAGEYLYEGKDYKVHVDADGVAVLTAYGAEGEVVLSFSTRKGDAGDKVNYEVEVDPEVDSDKLGSYTVVGDEAGGAIDVTDEAGNTYHYDAKSGVLTPAQ